LKTRLVILVAIILLLAASVGWCKKPKSVWDEMLAKVNLTPEKAQLDPGRWTGGGEYRLKVFQTLWDDWQKVDPTTIKLGEDVRRSKSLVELGWVAEKQLDLQGTVIRWYHRAPISPRLDLMNAIRQVQAYLGAPLSAQQTVDLQNSLRNVPEDVASAAAAILHDVPGALDARAKAFRAFSGSVFDKALPFATDYAIDDDTLKLIDKLDLQSLADGGIVLAHAVDEAILELKPPSREKFSFKWTTPAGDILLNGAQDNTYTGSWLLAIDTGGNDKYESASQGGKQQACVTIDLAGNDTYTLKDKGAFGGGTAVGGYSFQVDCAGNDTYTAEDVAFGVGAFGVGMLLDKGGNDIYKIRNLGQAAGVMGIGALVDQSGDDRYECYMEAQGFAGPRGCGILFDAKGNDVYDANDTNLVNPSPQTAAHNTSLAQGCSFGRRAHPGDGHSMAGGVGVLVDGAGNDKYSSGVFGQGIAYWYGYGALVDFSGNDSYKGVWYAQGACAHYAIAELYDASGNDQYVASMDQSEGHARDYSIGVLHDARGNDTYSCPAWAFGSGNISSIGVFWDGAGNDTYAESAYSFGFADTSNPAMALGLFRDDGGKNTFPPGSLAKNKSVWIQNPAFPYCGVGVSK